MENSEDLENKYIELLRAEKHSPVRGTYDAENPIFAGFSAQNDSQPIVFQNNFPLAQRYKKAKLCKASSGWYAWFEYRNPVTGEWEAFTRRHGINRIKGTNEKKAEAVALVEALNRLLADGWNPYGYTTETSDLRDKTLLECIKYHLKFRKSLRKRSYQNYADSVRVFEEWLIAAGMKFIFPQSFKAVQAIRFGEYMTAVKGYSGKSHNHHKSNMGWFFNRLVDDEIILKNPLTKIPNRPQDAEMNLAYTRSERELLKNYFTENNPLLGEFCQCLYFLGIRPEELLQVQLRDVFIDQRKIMIYTGAAKSRRQEPVYMSEAMVKMIEAKNIEVYPPDHFLFGHKLKIADKRWIRNRISEMHSEVRKNLGLNENHTLYSWKHTGAIEFYYNNGKDIYKLMKHLRHTDIKSTMKYIRTLGLDYNSEIQVPAF